MARILLAWELGGGYGHVVRLGALARALAARGHEPVLALKDLAFVAERIGAAGLSCLQAPVWVQPRATRGEELSYADILLSVGFGDPVRLSGLVGGWRGLIDLVDPDLLVSDMAPAALVAAAIDDLPAILIGSGFFPPPLATPLPPLNPHAPADPAALADSDAKVTACLNALRRAAGLAPVASVRALFDLPTIHCCLRETDPYGPRAGTFVLPMVETDAGVRPRWPPGEGPRLFGYLSGVHPGFDRIVEALQGMASPILLHVRDVDDARAATLGRPHLAVSTLPVQMRAALAECALVLCHGGHGTVDAALLAGRPLVVAPGQVENGLIGGRVVAAGLADHIRGGDSPERIRRVLETALASEPLALAARKIAARYAEARDPAQASADVCEASLGP